MINGMLQKALLRGNASRTLTDAETITAAAGAGAISAIVYSPVDLLTIQQQKLHMNLWNTTKTLAQTYGMAGLYRGFSACVAREALYTAGYLGLAPVITSRLISDSDFLAERPLIASITGACMAGTLAAVTTHPIDTAKTCIQSDMEGRTWKSTFGTMKKLVSGGGIASLYRGMFPRTVRLCGAFFVCLMVRDAAIEYKTQCAHNNQGMFLGVAELAPAGVTPPVVATSASDVGKSDEK
jgi:hypothetical protein